MKVRNVAAGGASGTKDGESRDLTISDQPNILNIKYKALQHQFSLLQLKVQAQAQALPS